MDLAEIPLFAMLRGRLGYLSERQRVIAENVANADTPGYAPHDLKPFSVQAAIAASALRAQQARMRIIAENLANADSTSRTHGGDPYRRQAPVFQPSKVGGGTGVKMTRAAPDESPFKTTYDPGHPSADAQGY